MRDLSKYTDVGGYLLHMDYYYKYTSEPDANGCTVWLAGKHKQGYGMLGCIRISDNKKIMMTAHRMAMVIKLGRPLAPGEFVLHDCGCHNPACINPDHLEIGTLGLRNKRMHQLGRWHPRTGVNTRNHRRQNREYKYTDEEMLFIRNNKPQAIVARFGWPIKKAYRLRYAFRKHYAWLADLETK